jgi:peptidylprolyl isomerase
MFFMAETIKSGDTIKVHYTGRFENGEVFDSSEGRAPLQFTVGGGQLIKGFDAAVIGLQAGDKTTATIPPEDAYGVTRPELLVEFPRERVPADMELTIGQRLHLRDGQGNPVPATVVEIGEAIVRLDANHPMAGKTLVFDIEVVETGLEAKAQEEHCGTGHKGCQGCGKH